MNAKVFAEFARLTSLTFPRGTRPLGMTTSKFGMDKSIQMKLEIPASEFAKFLGSPPLVGQTFSDTNRALLGADNGYWDPSRFTQLPTVSTNLGNDAGLVVGYDGSLPAAVTVYASWFEF